MRIGSENPPYYIRTVELAMQKTEQRLYYNVHEWRAKDMGTDINEESGKVAWIVSPEFALQSATRPTAHNECSPNRRTNQRLGDYEIHLHLHQLLPDITPSHETHRLSTLLIFPIYNILNSHNNRDDDNINYLGFEVTRERVALTNSALYLAPHYSREISKDEFYTAVEGPTTGELKDVLRYNISDRANQIINFGDNEIVRNAANTGRGLEEARIDEITEARVFSAVVGTIFDGKNVTAMIRTSVDGEQNITYRFHAYGLDVRAGDFVWGPEALAFKEARGIRHGGECQLDE